MTQKIFFCIASSSSSFIEDDDDFFAEIQRGNPQTPKKNVNNFYTKIF
jgi:hypothetical protein